MVNSPLGGINRGQFRAWRNVAFLPPLGEEDRRSGGGKGSPAVRFDTGPHLTASRSVRPHRGRRTRQTYFGFRAAWTSISTSMPGWTSEVIWLVMREGLLGCSGVPKKVL
jgi:hypothetical protein